MENKELDYQDESGTWWVMCACGHRVGGSPRPGDKIALCVNCRFTGSLVGGSFPIVYPDRIPDDGSLSQEGNHPDHIAIRAVMAYKKEQSDKRKARRLRRANGK
jgi:hypothetical protein